MSKSADRASKKSASASGNSGSEGKKRNPSGGPEEPMGLGKIARPVPMVGRQSRLRVPEQSAEQPKIHRHTMPATSEGDRFPCIFPADQETGSLEAASTAIQSTAAETTHPLPPAVQKLPRVRGVLREAHSRIGTGDGTFQANSAALAAFVSVGEFGGSDSLPFRPKGCTDWLCCQLVSVSAASARSFGPSGSDQMHCGSI